MGKDVIVAPIFRAAARRWAFSAFKEEKPYVKIGMELFTGKGRRWCGDQSAGSPHFWT